MDILITTAEIIGAVLLIAALAAAVYLHCREQYPAAPAPDAETGPAPETEKVLTEDRKNQ